MEMDMSMDGIAIRPDPYLAKVYWMFAGGFIALAILVNLKEEIEYRLRSVAIPHLQVHAQMLMWLL
jgi:hypothetical protein